MRSEQGEAKSANRSAKKRSEQPVLITEAPPSPKAELDYRRRRYAITMGIRVVCLILAAAFHNIIWLWPVFAVGALALPWIAVVLANDRLPAKSSRFQRYSGVPERQLPEHGESHRVIDE
jgi:Flp pilus assembly protein TadB